MYERFNKRLSSIISDQTKTDREIKEKTRHTQVVITSLRVCLLSFSMYVPGERATLR